MNLCRTCPFLLLLVLMLSGRSQAQPAEDPLAPIPPFGRDPLAGTVDGVPRAEPFTVEAAVRQEAFAWDVVHAAVLEQIRPPTFPDRTCRVADYGAAPDDGRDDRPALRAAMAACADAGGGRVVLSPGEWLSDGPLRFRSNIDLHLEEGALLLFGTDPADYIPLVLVRWEGLFAYNYSPLLYARDVENVAITGAGTIDGQAAGTWGRWKRDNGGRNQEADKDRLRQMGLDGVPVGTRIFGHGHADPEGDGTPEGDGQPHYLRPALLQFLGVRNVLIEGVTLRGAPFWTVHPVLCENVTVRRVTIRPGTTNDDGINPESSRFVLIEENDIWTHDDPIALKAGRDRDGRQYPGTAYVVIRHNRLRSTVGGALSIGSEMSGGVAWVFVHDTVGHNAAGRGLYLKSNRDRGGFIRHLYVRDLDLTGAVNGFEITTDYKGWRGTDHPPDVHDVFLHDVRIWHASERSLQLLGQAGVPVRRIALRDVHIHGPKDLSAPVLRHAKTLVIDTVRIGGQPWGSGR